MIGTFSLRATFSLIDGKYLAFEDRRRDAHVAQRDGVTGQRVVVSTVKSARLPARKLPVMSAMPMACAALMVMASEPVVG